MYIHDCAIATPSDHQKEKVFSTIALCVSHPDCVNHGYCRSFCCSVCVNVIVGVLSDRITRIFNTDESEEDVACYLSR